MHARYAPGGFIRALSTDANRVPRTDDCGAHILPESVTNFSLWVANS
jgi:hypothetical protein